MRSFITITSTLLVFLIAPFAAEAAELTSKNSVVAEFPFADFVEAKAPDCATPGIGLIPVPADALSVKVKSPKVGANFSGVRVSGIDGVAPGFSITFNADPDVCDPALNDSPPGTVVPWNLRVPASGIYDRRVAACLRPYFDKYSTKKCKVRPRKVFTGIEGIERGFRAYYYGIRWKSFGAAKASGKGKYKQECGGGRCAPAKKVRIVADKAKFCGDTKSVEYTRLTSYSGGKLWFRQRNVC